ncbi:MAG: GxxExxY protein [Bacteroidota bacterium]
MELESNGVPFAREVKYDVYYKDKLLSKKYYADFVIDDKIILELKAIEGIHSSHVKQTLNYLAASKLKLGIVVNFGEDHLNYKRVVL